MFPFVSARKASCCIRSARGRDQNGWLEVLFFLLTGVAIGLVGCGGPDEKIISAALKSDLSALWSGTVADLGTSKVDGDKIVYSNVKITQADSGISLTAETTQVVKPELVGDGGLKADAIILRNVELGNNELRYTTSEVRFAKANIVPPSADYGRTVIEFEKAESNSVTGIGVNGSAEFATHILASASKYKNGIPQSLTLKLDGLPPDAPKVIVRNWIYDVDRVFGEMGYSNLRLSFGLGYDWDQDTGKLSLHNLSLVGDEAASLNISGELESFDRSMLDLNKSIIDQGTIASKSAIKKIKISYSDNSLATRIIDLVASRSGLSRTMLVDSALTGLPIALGELKSPKLQDDIMIAAKAFLPDPKTVDISLSPEKPVSFEYLSKAIEQSPQRLAGEAGPNAPARQEKP